MALRILVLSFAVAACAAETSSKQLVIPQDMLRPISMGPAPARAAAEPQKDAKPAVLLTPAGNAVPAPIKAEAPQRYVVRVTEHGRTWELDLPEATGGYELNIPLGEPVPAPTAADGELLAGKTGPRSYLAAMAALGDLYSAHKYELALIQAVELEGAYPRDARLQAMKGSLYRKLGKPDLARGAWQKALELDPADAAVAEALRGLTDKEQ